MAPPDVWTNPLQALALITENPARLSEELSSALSDPNEFETARQRAKTLVEDYQRVSPSDDTAPVLRLFLEKLPKQGQTALISDIITSENLRTLRDHLVDAILKPMKLSGGKQPVTAPSNPLQLEQIDLAMTEIEPSVRNQTRLKRDCLKRDGFRCSISGYHDRSSVRNGSVILPAGKRATVTQCAHILPFALSDFDERSVAEARNKAIVWTALHRYFPALRGKINTNSVNQYGNVMIMDNSIHAAFGEYSIGLWPMDEDNTYHIRSLDGLGLPAGIPTDREYVQFISHDHQLPLPDKDFLKTHYRIGEILQLAKRDAEISII
ncbi:hypothetical protein TsFJ059_007628 [Trichoderma semiorbis]|uniref:HNH nuclease domain-containing protein n=1 Tax=Trichoderma semiorbis TaxID=1491008 RepID=A0A9P8HFC3_9HYPO|nr:hypothetical protein TsFJ059_007628 [Trichoderma semiorbis]